MFEWRFGQALAAEPLPAMRLGIIAGMKGYYTYFDPSGDANSASAAKPAKRIAVVTQGVKIGRASCRERV